jgi:PadR family transcriptional regulator PadR
MMGVADDSGRDWLAQARRGVVELCVLSLLDDHPSYGYELIQALRTWQPLAASEGTLYPLLHRLSRLGYLAVGWQESTAGPPRKYYELTPAGRQLLHRQRDEWQQLTHAVSQLHAFSHNNEDKGVPDGSGRNLTLSERTAAASGTPAGG